MKILVVDDDAGLRRTASLILENEGYDVATASDGEEALARAAEWLPDLILTDVRMPGVDGLEFLERHREAGGAARTIVMTAYGSQDLAVEAIRKGAYDYIDKPFSPEALLLRIRIAEEHGSKDREIRRLRKEVRVEKRRGDIVVASAGMKAAVELAERVAQHPTTVLITGESGTGKELVARLVHQASNRADGPFVPVNCGAIPENLLESELFGHSKGSFTGASRDRAGLFEEANGGTLLLDEIGELPQALQVKLLRVLQEGEIRRVGESKARQLDVRILAATARDLEADVKEGRVSLRSLLSHQRGARSSAAAAPPGRRCARSAAALPRSVQREAGSGDRGIRAGGHQGPDRLLVARQHPGARERGGAGDGAGATETGLARPICPRGFAIPRPPSRGSRATCPATSSR